MSKFQFGKFCRDVGILDGKRRDGKPDGCSTYLLFLLLTAYYVLRTAIAYCALLTTLGTSNGCKTMHMGEVDPVRKYSHSKYGEVDPVSRAIVSTARWTCFQRVTQ